MTYYKMRDEMWLMGELEYACICVMEGQGFDYYDYEKSTPQKLIDDAEYVLATYYEHGHVRHDELKEGTEENQKSCREEIKDIRKWLRKWKPKTKFGETHPSLIKL